MAVRSVLSGLSDSVFVAGFEIQNSLKSVYGADVLAGAAYYNKERKEGHAYFFPGIFANRAKAYYDKFGYDIVRKGMAKWYEQAILNARKNPKAQEYHNSSSDLFSLGMTPPDPEKFIPYLNYFDCSKVTDGASSLMVLSEEGLKKCGLNIEDTIEIIAMGEAVDDITLPPRDLTFLETTAIAAEKAFEMANLKIDDIGILEVHDCFTISGLLSLEALAIVKAGEAPSFIFEGNTGKEGSLPTNLSGGLGGFGHPTGATGIRQMVDLLHQLTHKAENQVEMHKPFGMMVSMGGNDKTVTAFIVKRPWQ